MKVGDYVRTKNGLIAKIVNINDFREPSLKYGIEANYIVDIGFIGDEDIKISSPNIRDLIEAGDYVNGCKVYQVNNAKIIIGGLNGLYDIQEDGIQTILTKEQFKKREYRVGD